jgi:hypothetical protein
MSGKAQLGVNGYLLSEFNYGPMRPLAGKPESRDAKRMGDF